MLNNKLLDSLNNDIENVEDKIRELAHLITYSSLGTRLQERETYWSKTSCAFITAILGLMYIDFSEEEFNESTFRSLVNKLSYEEDEDEKYIKLELDYIFKIFGKKHGTDNFAYKIYFDLRKMASTSVLEQFANIAKFNVADFVSFRTEEREREERIIRNKYIYREQINNIFDKLEIENILAKQQNSRTKKRVFKLFIKELRKEINDIN